MEKDKLLEKFITHMKNNNFSDLTFRKLMTFTYDKDKVIGLINYLDSSYSNQVRISIFELLSSSGVEPIALFEQYFSKETNTSLPGKIIDVACKTGNEDLILAVYSKYPSLSTMALMKLKKMKKFDAIAPFLFSENVSLANLASQILNNSDN